MEIITFREWLPAVLGPRLMAKYHLDVLATGYTTYDPELNPTMTIEFSSSAMRSFGHSAVSGDMFRVYEDGTKVATPLAHNFHHLGD